MADDPLRNITEQAMRCPVVKGQDALEMMGFLWEKQRARTQAILRFLARITGERSPDA